MAAAAVWVAGGRWAGIFQISVNFRIDTGTVFGVDEHEHWYHRQDQDHGEEANHHEVEDDGVVGEEFLDVLVPCQDVIYRRPSSGRVNHNWFLTANKIILDDFQDFVQDWHT